jgi:hypothetical protein
MFLFCVISNNLFALEFVSRPRSVFSLIFIGVTGMGIIWTGKFRLQVASVSYFSDDGLSVGISLLIFDQYNKLELSCCIMISKVQWCNIMVGGNRRGRTHLFWR